MHYDLKKAMEIQLCIFSVTVTYMVRSCKDVMVVHICVRMTQLLQDYAAVVDYYLFRIQNGRYGCTNTVGRSIFPTIADVRVYYSVLFFRFLRFLACFPKKENEVYEITSLSVSLPLITFEPSDRFLWNSVGRSCHWRWPRRHTY
jgi:hypothetical protein